VIEYCLSFCYAIADVAAWTGPKQVVAQVILRGAAGTVLPLGEGGSIWADAPGMPLSRLQDETVVSPAIVFDTTSGPLRVRRYAYDLASQIYGFFGHLGARVPFVHNGVVTFYSDAEEARLAAIKSYVQGALLALMEQPVYQPGSSVHWLHSKFRRPGIRLAVSDEFVQDFGADEDELFKRLDVSELRELLLPKNKGKAPLITTSGINWDWKPS
jgi:hypothetical protein